MRRVLGLDSSLSAFGWAVLEFTSGPLACTGAGTWKTKPDDKEKRTTDDRARRIRELGERLLALIERSQPIESVFIESLALGMKTGRLQAQVMGRVRGLVEGICITKGLHLVEIAPATLKFAVTGNKGASKDEVAAVMRRLYLCAHAQDDNGTDAIAVGHVGASRLGPAVSSAVKSYRPVRFEPGGEYGDLDLDF